MLQITPSRSFALYLHGTTSPPDRIDLEIGSLSVADHLVHIGTMRRLKVVEHLFSALYGLGLYKVRIDSFGDEIPFFDGSSRDFTKSLVKFKSDSQARPIKIRKSFTVRSKGSFIHYEPAGTDKLVIDMELAHPCIKKQKFCFSLDRMSYIKEIASARTFACVRKNDPRLRDLPPYGFGITRDRVYAREPLRYPDEAVRHKILDLLGDLYVLQGRLSGRITARNTSHWLNIAFAKKTLKEFAE